LLDRNRKKKLRTEGNAKKKRKKGDGTKDENVPDRRHVVIFAGKKSEAFQCAAHRTGGDLGKGKEVSAEKKAAVRSSLQERGKRVFPYSQDDLERTGVGKKKKWSGAWGRGGGASEKGWGPLTRRKRKKPYLPNARNPGRRGDGATGNTSLAGKKRLPVRENMVTIRVMGEKKKVRGGVDRQHGEKKGKSVPNNDEAKGERDLFPFQKKSIPFHEYRSRRGGKKREKETIKRQGKERRYTASLKNEKKKKNINA